MTKKNQRNKQTMRLIHLPYPVHCNHLYCGLPVFDRIDCPVEASRRRFHHATHKLILRSMYFISPPSISSLCARRYSSILPMTAVLYWVDSPEVSRRHYHRAVLRVRVVNCSLAQVRVDVECRFTSSAPRATLSIRSRLAACKFITCHSGTQNAVVHHVVIERG